MPPPSFFVDIDTFPDVAEHILSSQKSGAPGANIPLTRITDILLIESNRDTACIDFPRPAGMSVGRPERLFHFRNCRVTHSCAAPGYDRSGEEVACAYPKGVARRP